MIDVLDELQAVDGYVQLVLKNGEIQFGKPDCIVYDEDKEGFDTIKTIRFVPWNSTYAVYYKEDEIQNFDEVKKKEIPVLQRHLKGS